MFSCVSPEKRVKKERRLHAVRHELRELQRLGFEV